MSAHRVLHDLQLADNGITDPGDAGTISPVKDFAYVPMVSAAGAETRTLADPTREGKFIALGMTTDGGGAITVTASTAYDQAGSTTLTFNDAGDYALLQSVQTSTTAFAWRLVSRDGAPGSNGTVTQATSKATGVTVNSKSGQITTHAAALAAAAEVAFTVTNSAVTATSVIVVNVASGQTAAEEHIVWVGAVAAGSFDIAIGNLSASSASDALVINFTVIN